MTQTVGFIGAGSISSQLARLAVAAGLDVVLSNSRSPDTLAGLIAQLGERARAATPTEAAREGDLVVVSIPLFAYRELPADALAGKVVVDTMNYYPARDGDMPGLETDKVTTSELVQKHLDRSRVVRALNNMDWVRLFGRARPAGAPDRSALPIAGDDAAAKGAVAKFMDAIGYDAVDIGPLAESWRSGPGAPGYVLPYIGEIPTDLKPEEERPWFLQAPGAPVSAEQVAAFAAQAVRRPDMFGDVASLPGATL
jgi:predicted dinucleotide-binding enzyme